MYYYPASVAGGSQQMVLATLVAGTITIAAAINVTANTQAFITPIGNNGGAASGTPTLISKVVGVPGTGSVTITSISPAAGATVATDVRQIAVLLVG